MAKTKKFTSLLNEIIEATTEEELNNICYRADGIDMSYQREEITWDQHETLFNLVNKLNGFYRPIEEEPEEDPEQTEEQQPTDEQAAVFKICDFLIAQADTTDEIARLERMVNNEHRLGNLTDVQREALEGACIYKEMTITGAGSPSRSGS